MQLHSISSCAITGHHRGRPALSALLPALRKVYNGMRSLLSLLSSKLNKPNDHSHSSGLCPQDLSQSLLPSTGRTQIVWCPYVVVPKAVFLRWGSPSTEQDNPLPFLAGDAVPDGWPCRPFGGQSTLLTSTCHQPWVPFWRAALQPLSPRFVHIIRVTPISGGESSTCSQTFHAVVHCQLSSLSISLFKASLPTREFLTPPNLISSLKLLTVHSIPASR